MEELADDVGGGGDAEDDGAEDFLPPWQQQHGVLSPASLAARPVSLYHAHGAVTPVAPSVGEVVAVVYRGEKKESVSGGSVHFVAVFSSHSTRFLPYGYWRMDSAPLLYSSWENLSLFRHLSNSSEPTRAGVRDGESVSRTR